MKSKFLWVAGVLALPASGVVSAQQAEKGHDHGQRSAAVETALDAAVARVPKADYGTMKLRRQTYPGKAGIVENIMIDNPVGMSVVVVIDENGEAHTECVESAAPHVVAGSSREPIQ